MGYLDMTPPENTDQSTTLIVHIPIELTTESNQDDIITVWGKDLNDYTDIKELKESIKQLITIYK